MGRALLGGGLAVLSLAAAQAAEPPSQEAVRTIEETLAARYPDVRVESVGASPWPGLFEVETGKELVYSNADASLLFLGRIIDTRERVDLTARRFAELRAIHFDRLPLELALRRIKGDGSRRLVVFADPDCPFCEELERTLESIDDVVVYTFLVPFESLHPEAPARARAILCALDPALAWRQWMLEGKPPPPASCGSERYDAMLALARRLKVDSTPTLVFANDRRVDGALDAAQLQQHFAAASSATPARDAATVPAAGVAR
jgi:thiol:disulfide interchange protein DsbC